jgi:hypothetical protein
MRKNNGENKPKQRKGGEGGRKRERERERSEKQKPMSKHIGQKQNQT